MLLPEVLYIAKIIPQALVKSQPCHASCFLSPEATTTQFFTMTAFHQPYEPGVGAKLAVVKFVHDLDIAEGQQHACRAVLQVIAHDLRSSSGSSAGMCYSAGMRSDPPRGPSLGPCVCIYMHHEVQSLLVSICTLQ